MKVYLSRRRAVCAAVSTALITPCFAQTAAESSEPQDIALAEVVVTGSRLASGFDTPTPVTMISAEDLMAAAPNSIGESLAQLPSLVNSIQSATSGTGSANDQTNGQDLLDLRGLGPERTLVLLDGQRMGVTNVVGSVDINIIPQSLVKRVDVVTGGASASYGSDAVAGVANFILDTQFEGLKAEVNFGQTAYNDVQNGKTTVTFGKHLSERARVVGSLEYYRLKGLQWGEDTGRDWHTNPPMSVATGGTPTFLRVPNTRSRYGTFGGTITAVTGCATGAAGDPCRALVEKEFMSDGTLVPLAPAQFVYGNNAFVSGGSGAIVNNAFAPTRSERKAVFLHGEFDTNDYVTVWGQVSYNSSETFNQAQVLQSQTNNQFRIFDDNAFLPAAVAAVLRNDPGQDSFTVTRFSRDLGFNEVTGNTYVTRFAGGVKGDINERWSYDTIFGYQNSHQDLDVRTAIMRNLYAAADAVVNPANGQIVCRSTIYATPTSTTPVAGGTGMDPGCVPLNIFGDGAPSQAAEDYVMGLNTADTDLKQSTFDMNLRGDFGDDISLGAGPISFATGMSYRRLTSDRTVDPLSNIYKNMTGVRGSPNIDGTYGGYSYHNPAPVSGKVSVTEGYMEFGLPLLRDRPGVQELSSTLAGRVVDYSQSGVKNMWKIGLNWTVNDSVRFRGTISADTRAPTVLELFNTALVSRGTYNLPDVGLQGSGQNIAIGNTNLAPEDAKTYTAGVVFNPRFLPGFQASVDWYEINLLGSIAAPESQDLIDDCYAGDQAACAYITVNGHSVTTTGGLNVNDFIAVTNELSNQPADVSSSGLDFDIAYRTPIGAGDLSLRFNGLYMLKQYNPNNTCVVGAAGTREDDLAGTIGDCGEFPEIRGRFAARYNIGRFGAYVQERYVDGGLRNPNYVNGVDINDNNVKAVWYTDMSFTYRLSESAGREVYFNITNLFDQDPQYLHSTRGASWVRQAGPYDFLGRRFLIGARYKFF